MNKTLLTCLLLFTFLTSSNLLADVKLVDVSNLNIEGIRLGMSKKQAFKAISNKLKLKESDIKKTPFPDMYSVTYGKFMILIVFTATSIDLNNSSEIVSGVRYKTLDNIDQKNKKYNAEFCPDKPFLGYSWCEGIL